MALRSGNDAVDTSPSGESKMIEEESEFVTDAYLAHHLGMAVATIRAQRFKRRHGQEHWLTIDAVTIGNRPRYRRSEAIAWLQGQVRENTIQKQ